MEERKHRLYDANRKIKCEKKIKVQIFWSIVFILLCTVRSVAYASEFGGFDISTGSGELNEELSGWDDEPEYYAPGQVPNESDTYEDSSASSWGETDMNITNSSGEAFYDESRNEDTGYEEYREERKNENITANIINETVIEDSTVQETLPEMKALPSEEIKSIKVTETPTPVQTPTPTIMVTDTPIPQFTEVPESEEKTVIEYFKEYKLPPTECRTKMKLVYFKTKLPERKNVKIHLDKNITIEIVSVRVDGQEISWKTENDLLMLDGLTEEKNALELAVMVPEDFAWTEEKKSVILA